VKLELRGKELSVKLHRSENRIKRKEILVKQYISETSIKRGRKVSKILQK
jgi:hypothetical protein